jgi:hypothetical protein
MPELGRPERFRAGLHQLVELLHRRGVTAFNEPGALIPSHLAPLCREVFGADSTPMYAFFIAETKAAFFRRGRDGLLAALEAANATFPAEGKVRFLPKQAKLLFDGAIISQRMQMQAPYLDGHHGDWIQSPEEVEQITGVLWPAGYQLHVHVNGDLGLQRLIEILEQRMREHPRRDHRTTIVHFASSTAGQVRRLGELGVLISANPYYVTAFGERFGETGLGAKRAHAMLRLHNAETAGIPISLHSDLPMAPADPLFLAWSAATRRTLGGRTRRPDLALSRDAALRAITIEAARSLRMEETLGSLEPGKIANFTLLDADPSAVPLDALRELRVHATVFEGRLFPVADRTPHPGGVGFVTWELP